MINNKERTREGEGRGCGVGKSANQALSSVFSLEDIKHLQLLRFLGATFPLFMARLIALDTATLLLRHGRQMRLSVPLFAYWVPFFTLVNHFSLVDGSGGGGGGKDSIPIDTGLHPSALGPQPNRFIKSWGQRSVWFTMGLRHHRLTWKQNNSEPAQVDLEAIEWADAIMARQWVESTTSCGKYSWSSPWPRLRINSSAPVNDGTVITQTRTRTRSASSNNITRMITCIQLTLMLVTVYSLSLPRSLSLSFCWSDPQRPDTLSNGFCQQVPFLQSFPADCAVNTNRFIFNFSYIYIYIYIYIYLFIYFIFIYWYIRGRVWVGAWVWVGGWEGGVCLLGFIKRKFTRCDHWVSFTIFFILFWFLIIKHERTW